MANDTLFRRTAPRYMRQFMADFAATKLDAAAVFGNAGHESAGFTALQEIKPTVAGSRGGWGWFQWTGPRRRAFEAYCKRNGKDPASHDANYAWLFVELKGDERRAIPALKAAKTLDDKVVAFERAFERAGIKHYDSRKRWARVALEAYDAEPFLPVVPSPDPESGIGSLLLSLIRAVLALFRRT